MHGRSSARHAELAQQRSSLNPALELQRQAVFVLSNDTDASSTIASVAAQLGFAPIEFGRLDQGGTPLHVVGGQPGGLLFQNSVKVGVIAAVSAYMLFRKCNRAKRARPRELSNGGSLLGVRLPLSNPPSRSQ
jgi:hypothetical protein